MKKVKVVFPRPNGPMTNNEFTAQRAQDSTSMTTMALHNLPIPVIPRAVRVFLISRMSRTMVMVVRRMLSEGEIARYGRADHISNGICALW